MDDHARLTRSICLSVAGFLVFQLALFLGFAKAFHFAVGYIKLFFITSVVFHVAILIFLLAFRGDFSLVDSGKKLTHVNLANEITLVRLSTLPTLLILIIASKEYSIQTQLLLLVAFVFLTDFADGWVSRAAGQVTHMGRMLDSISDYSLLIVLSIVFYYYKFIPAWFFWLAAFRLFSQGLAMAVLLLTKHTINTQSTFMGKAAIFATMALYTAEILRVATKLEVTWIWHGLEYIAGAIVFISIFEKIAMFISEIRHKPNKEVDSPATLPDESPKTKTGA